jgi:hypothetical protein
VMCARKSWRRASNWIRTAGWWWNWRRTRRRKSSGRVEGTEGSPTPNYFRGAPTARAQCHPPALGSFRRRLEAMAGQDGAARSPKSTKLTSRHSWDSVRGGGAGVREPAGRSGKKMIMCDWAEPLSAKIIGPFTNSTHVTRKAFGVANSVEF